MAASVGSGALAPIDQWSVDHLMPGLTARASSPTWAKAVFPIFNPDKYHGHIAIAASTYAVVWLASAVPSIVIVAITSLVLGRRRNTRRTAIAIVVAFIVANVVEILGKSLITRPALRASGEHRLIYGRPFDNSFPSGHEIRAVVLGICFAACMRALWPLAVAWLIAVSALLVAGGWHTPSDVAGSLLIAASVSLAAFSRTTTDLISVGLFHSSRFTKARLRRQGVAP